MPAPAPSPYPAPLGNGKLGINVSTSVYYNTERTFANLAQAASQWLDPSAGWGGMAADKLNSHGNPAEAGVMPLNPPQTGWSGKN
ncbi:MAG TPA: hypothetical protein VF637_13045, partial [Sphingomicrobium sp.]